MEQLISSGNVTRNDIDIEDDAIKVQDQKQSTNQKEKKKDERNRILASKFSLSWNYFAVCDDEKKLYLFQRDGEQLEKVSGRCTQRRCTALTFTESEQYILVADKWGDVFRFSVTEPHKEGQLLLGHLSMLLDIICTKEDKYVVTADRDDKIRISNYPNSYNVYRYCLVHTEFVSSLVYVEDPELLISGSGDGGLVVWNLDGNILARTFCYDETTRTNLPVQKIVMDSQSKQAKILAVTFFNSPLLKLFYLTCSGDFTALQELQTTELQSVVWNTSFDNKHQLWLTHHKQWETVLIYTCDPNGEKTQLEPLDTSKDVIENKMRLKLNQDWEFFKASSEVPDVSAELKKKETPDNYAIYLQKKQHRLNQTLKECPDSVPQQKKSKLS